MFFQQACAEYQQFYYQLSAFNVSCDRVCGVNTMGNYQVNYHLRDGTQNLEVGAGLDVAKFMDLAEVKNLANSPVRISNNTQLFNTYHNPYPN